ncbi:hypothetical protein BJ742DRAFT_841326 [Cladochytrium replicatum]|nr:hypothetical protein BJ742DRAFT_841326 [Cladochytrium replicatum]
MTIPKKLQPKTNNHKQQKKEQNNANAVSGSEIDAIDVIFGASKKDLSASNANADKSGSETLKQDAESGEKRKRGGKDKKAGKEPSQSETKDSSSGEKKKEVETVVFKVPEVPKKKQKVPPPDADDDFADSRGTRSSRGKTDDGYSLYSVDELKLSNQGGDTPLCPFDCECCF